MTRDWVPEVTPESGSGEDGAMEQLVRLLEGHRTLVLTGAGCSTESGIPDYRGPKTILRKASPVQYLTFVKNEEARKRYWARSFVGWPIFSRAEPNAAHRALATLENAGIFEGIITQNVDRLHQKAGSRDVLDLHGALAEVICLDCRRVSCRNELQERLELLNPEWSHQVSELAPDGDIHLEHIPADFRVPRCQRCHGVLKPHVVFFGENVARSVVDRAWRMLDEAQALLVLGSSLTVFSGYRFVREADKRGMPVAIVNVGSTRGDAHACLRIHQLVSATLEYVAERMGEPRPY
jgi:NAD+-dependent protein deacetylase sirtuin 4